MATQEPNNTLGRTTPRRPVFSWLVFFSSAAVVAFLAVELVYSVPAMKRLFQEWKLKLPAPTELLLELSDAFIAGGWIVFAAIPIILGFLAPRLSRTRKLRSPEDYARTINRLIATMIVGLSVLGMTVVVHIAMDLPMRALIEGISGNAAGR